MPSYWEINGGKFRVEYDPATGNYVGKPVPDSKAQAKLRRKQKKALAKLAEATSLAKEASNKREA